jgi:hypothetical protein
VFSSGFRLQGPEVNMSGQVGRCFGFQTFRISGFGFRVRGSGFQVPGFGFRASGPEFSGLEGAPWTRRQGRIP